MVLYHIITMYHLLNAITFHKKYHINKKAVLIIPDFFLEIMDKEKINELIDKGFVSEVVSFPYKEVKLNSSVSAQVEGIVHDLLPYHFEEFDEIYVWGFHFYFTAELLDKNIQFNVAEEAAGAFSKKEICADAISKNKFHFEWANSNGLLDYSNNYIKKIIVNKSAQTISFDDSRLFDFDVTQCLLEMDDDYKNKILALFNIERERVKIQKRDVILLTQHFMNLDILKYEEQKELYQTFLDFMFPNEEITIKPHPSDLMDYENIFPNTDIMRGKFPLEIMPMLADTSDNSIVSVYSTGIESLEKYFGQAININMSYRDEYKETPLLWSAISLIRECLGSKKFQLGIGGINGEALKLLLKKSFHDMEIIVSDIENNTEWLVVGSIQDNEDKYQYIKKISMRYPNINMIFLNLNEDYLFYELLEECLIVPIKVNCYGKERKIYITTKQREVGERIYNVKMEKGLFHSGEKIEIETINKQEVEIAVLEGKLKATEARLKYYVDLVDKIRKGECI